MQRPHFLFIILPLIGCGPDEVEKKQSGPDIDRTVASTDTDDTDDTEDTDTETDTGTESFDCTQIPSPPFQTNSYPIQTQEDFDFAEGGYLVYQSGLAVVGTDKSGNTVVLSPGTAGDPRGVHGLSDGRIVIMSPWDGAIKIANPQTNGLQILAGGLDTPNGVEVDLDDRIYFTSYGEVGWTEPDGSDKQVIYNWGNYQAPNGITLSPDGQRLTVAVPAITTDFYTIDRLGPDDWGNVQVLYSTNDFYGALDTDVCGNIYTVNYWSGALWRIWPDGTPESLGQLTGGGFFGFSALRFGSGQGGWERARLYVTKRNAEVFEIFVGVPGRAHPLSP